jgi:hypothetical protein
MKCGETNIEFLMLRAILIKPSDYLVVEIIHSINCVIPQIIATRIKVNTIMAEIWANTLRAVFFIKSNK